MPLQIEGRDEQGAGFLGEVHLASPVALSFASARRARRRASRTLKKVSILQQPTVPELSLEPRRLYNSVVSTLLILIIAGIVHLLSAIIRDHQD